MSETSNKWTGPTLLDLMSYVEDTHVSPSASPVRVKAKKTRATSGHGYEKPYAFYDPVTQSLKMYEATCPLAHLPSLQKLPPSGMTQNGVLFLQPLWEGCTNAIDSSLWPTPRATMFKNRRWWTRPSGSHRYNLEEYGPHKFPHLRGRDINPEWIEWLMGFPTGWTEVEALETQLSPKSQK